MGATRGMMLLGIVVVVLCFPNYGCGMRSTIQLQVVDAETKQPIESAVALIYWLKPETFLFMRYPGRKGVELKETVSDKNGHFIIPRYSNKDYEYYLTIYKKGYVCWSNEMVFPTNQKRIGFMLKNGVVIAMEPFKKAYDKFDHADFVDTSSIWRTNLETDTSFFMKEINEEIELRWAERTRQERIEWQEKKRRE